MYIGYFVRGGVQIGADRDPTPNEFHQGYQSLVADYLGSQLGANSQFGTSRHFRELLTRSKEGIASNILADRLKRLEAAGLISRRDDPSHKQKAIYSLTEASIELVPLLAHTGGWGLRHTQASTELSIRAQILEGGGPPLWATFMAELRYIHLGAPRPERSVFAMLQSSYETTVAETT